MLEDMYQHHLVVKVTISSYVLMIFLAKHGYIFLDSNAFEALKNFKALVENLSGYKVKYLC